MKLKTLFALPIVGMLTLTTLVNANAYSADNITNYHPKKITNSTKLDTYLSLINSNPSTDWVVASSDKIPDTLSVLNMAKDKKIVLLNNDTYKFFLSKINSTPTSITVVGGEKSISKDVFDYLSTLAPTKRIAGENRYDTNKLTLPSYKSFVGVYGEASPDASIAGNWIKKGLGIKLIPTNYERVPNDNLKLIIGNGGSTRIVPGVEEIKVSGGNRYTTSQRALKRLEPFKLYLTDGKDFSETILTYNLANREQAWVGLDKNPEISPYPMERVVMPHLVYDDVAYTLPNTNVDYTISSIKDFKRFLSYARANIWAEATVRLKSSIDLKSDPIDTICYTYGVRPVFSERVREGEYIKYKTNFVNYDDRLPVDRQAYAKASKHIDYIIEKYHMNHSDGADRLVKEIINYFNDNTDYNMYLVNHEDKFLHYENSYPYSPINYTKGLCEGYTRAANWMLDKLGIHSYVSIVAQKSSSFWHAEIRVKVGDTWKYYDVTPRVGTAFGTNGEDTDANMHNMISEFPTKENVNNGYYKDYNRVYQYSPELDSIL